MVHPDTYVAQTLKGFGLFAKRPFQRGEILWITDDIDAKIPLSQYQALDAAQQRKLSIYAYLDDQRRVIVPWDEGKYVNHACDPNAGSLLEFDNISVARRAIGTGEEIVEDYYGYYGHFESFRCQCGSPNCRGLVEQKNSYRPELRLPLSDIGPLLMSLHQPLLAIRSTATKAFEHTLRQLAATVPASIP